MMKSCCQNSLGGWCSEEIPQHFSRKWSLSRNEFLSNHAEEERFLKQITAEIKTLNLVLLVSRGSLLNSCGQALPTVRHSFTQLLSTVGTATRHRRKYSPHMPRQWGWAAWLFPSLYSAKRGSKRITLRPQMHETVSQVLQ